MFSPKGAEPSPESLEAREVALATERISAAFQHPTSTVGLQQVDELVFEEDDEGENLEWEGAEEAREDDPVDLAMRIGSAGGMEMDDEDEGDGDDDEDEQIVYQSRSSGQINTG